MGGGGCISFDITLEASLKFSCCPNKRGLKILKVGQLKMPDLPAKDK